MPAALTVRVWDDPVITQHGYDPRSTYAEQFWLPTLGPSSLLLLRHLAAQFDATRGADITVPVAATAQALGLGPREGKNSPLMRSFARLAQFDLAHSQLDSEIWSVRPKVPAVTQRHIRRLPETSLCALEAWNAQPIRPDVDDERLRRARRTAFILIENGELADHVERILLGQGFPPNACRPAVEWAAQRHSLAVAAELDTDRQPALTAVPQLAADHVDRPEGATETGVLQVLASDRARASSSREQRDRTRPRRIPPPPSRRLTTSEV